MSKKTYTVKIYIKGGPDYPRIWVENVNGLNNRSRFWDRSVLEDENVDNSWCLGDISLKRLEEHHCTTECVGVYYEYRRRNVCKFTNLYTFVDEIQEEVNFLGAGLMRRYADGERSEDLMVEFDVEIDFDKLPKD